MQQQINLGTPPLGVGGDSYRTSFTKINQNFTEVYTALGTSALSGQLVLTREHMSDLVNLTSSTTVASSTAVKTAYDLAATKLTATANAVSASKLATVRTLSYTGDATGSMTFDGSANASAALTLANSGATAGTYPKVTVNAKGLVTSGTTLVAADIPVLDTAKITTGTLPVARGGTNLTASVQGGVLYGSSTSANAFTAAGTTNQVLKSNGTGAPTWQTLDLTYLPDASVKKSVKAATTANITLSGTQTIDGIALVAGDRVLVKNQTTQAENGIYSVSATAWTRTTDTDVITELAGAVVNVDSGTVNGGLRFDTDLKTTDTLGTTAVIWNRSIDTGMAGSVVGTTLGTAAIGTSDKYAREDHVHPLQTTVSGNAGTATKLATARTLALSGDVTGSATFDGSANSTITATVADNSHNHTIANVTNLQTTLDSMSITQTAALPATAGWYRIASSPLDIARVSGRFEVDWTLSGNHGQVIFNAAIMYGTGIALNQSLYSTYAVNGLTKTRIVYHTTYAGNYAYLEVYNSTAAAISVTVTGLGLMGWSLVTPSTAGSIPAGYTSRELTFVDGMSTEGQYVSTVATGTAPLSVASTTLVTNLNADLHDGYNTSTTATASTIPVRDASGNLAGNILGSAATLTTSRTISLTGEVTGSVSFNGSANAAIASTIANKGVANGIATLDATGKVPSAQLPSFVDDVLEYTNLASFPVTGETSKIYIDLTTGLTYRWSGSTYVGVGGGSGTADTALRLFTPRSISASGDATWSVSFDGSANSTAALTLANSGVTAGTYPKVTVDAKGRVTAGSAMVAADVPSLDTSKLTTGTLGVARGGTGLASFTQWGVPYASTTTAMAYTAAGTAGQVLKSNGAAAPTWVTLDLTYLPDASVKKSVRVATTANITLSAPQTIDGIAVVANDRVLVKDQTTASANGIYIVQAAAWIRATDADTSSKIGGAIVNVDSGTVNGGLRFDTNFKTTDTLGTTNMIWSMVVDTGMASTVVGTTPGTAAIGTSLNYARADHVHPVQTTITGNAATATTLATARNIALSGDVTGTVSFNGSANVTIASTITNKAAANGIATLDANGKVPEAQLPVLGQFIGTQATKAIYYNSKTIDEDITIPGTVNAMSAGPITISTGFTVTISDGATWTIV